MMDAERERLERRGTLSLAALQNEVYACRRCHDAGYDVQHAPVMAGEVSAPLLLVGQAPAAPDRTPGGRPFAGAAGRRLFRWLAEAGWDEEAFRRHCYITAITKCFPGPGPNGKGDRAPGRQEQALCRPFLLAELALVQPQVVIPVGRLAIEFFLGRGLPLADLVGRVFVAAPPSPVAGIAMVPLPHPSGASLWLNRPAHQALVAQALAHVQQLTETWRA